MPGTEVTFSGVSYCYDASSSLRKLALDDIDLTMGSEGFTILCGRTGSGKSTLAQHMNALLTPTVGKITFPGGFVLDVPARRRKDGSLKAPRRQRIRCWKELRKDVGLVFQFPEDQLFRRHVIEDVMVGPLNFGASEDEARRAAAEALAEVGLGESFFERSPFELSGGEKRRVALAGVFAFHPRMLVLDEPTVGLDPLGAKRVVECLRRKVASGVSVVLITHDMDLAYSLADRLIVMEEGKVVLDGKPWEVFQAGEIIHRAGLLPPKAFVYTRYLRSLGLDIDPAVARDAEGLAAELGRCIYG